jgi:hypothetical protein
MSGYLWVYNQIQFSNNSVLQKESKVFKQLNMFTWFTGIYCFLALVLVLSFELYILVVSKERLEEKPVSTKINHLYKNLNIDNKINLSFYLVFLIRRINLCLIILTM